MLRPHTTFRTERRRSLSFLLCALVAVPLVGKWDSRLSSTGTRTAFQLLEFKPGKENQRAQRTIIAGNTAH